VSRNFELMRLAGKEIGQRSLVREPLAPVDGTVVPRTSVAPRFEDSKGLEWLRTLEIFQKHWRVCVLFAALVMVAVAAFTFFSTPIYEATARVEVDPSGEKFSLNGSTGAADAEYLETQAQILQGDSLAIAVIRKMRLDQNQTLVGKLKPRVSKLSDVTDTQHLTREENIALGNFKNSLNVKRHTASRLILVTFASSDPQLAAQVCNTELELFIEQSFQVRHDAVMKSTEWLSRQLDDIRKKMEDSSQALTAFQQSIGVTDIDTNKSTFTEHMGELSRQQTAAQSERIQLQALLKNVSNPDSLPEVRSNVVVLQLSQKLAESRAALAQALVVYGENHPTAKKLQSEVDELQSQLDMQKKAIVSSLRASYAAALAREGMMSAEMKGTSQELDKMSKYSTLKKEVEANVALYNSLYGRIKEAGISAASKSPDIQIIDPARTPTVPARPRPALNLAIGMLVALIGSVGLAFILEELDNKLRSPEDIRKCIGTANVSVIPAIADPGCEEGRLTWPKRTTGILPPSSENDGVTTFFLDRPNSPESEAVQALYASIMLSWPNNPPRTLLIVSGLPGEGKTTVALNLSHVLAKNAPTCLVDADLRKGRVARAFGMPTGRGLADVLAGDIMLDQAIIKVPTMPSLSILPAGRSRGNFGQLICSEKMQEVLAVARERFGFVVVDSAPILPFVDGRALSTLVDAVVLVGRAGVTTRQAMRRSVELISGVHGAPILQIVLNGADPNTSDYKYYSYAYEDSTGLS
jgi:succinoglycan biosynthesis transport protein ExoP